MKKRFMILLALLLTLICVAASAQEYYTLPEIREQAAAGWHEKYTDKYGRTRQVDIDIEVFGEETAPVIKACWGNKQEYRYDGVSPRTAIKEARAKRGGISTYAYDSVRGMKVDLDYKYAEEYGNDLTLSDVYAFFDEPLKEQGLEQEYIWEQPYIFSILYSAKKNTGEVIVPALYSVDLWPEEFGLPILTHVAKSFKQGCKGPVISPGLTLQMRDQNEYLCHGIDFDIEEILAADIPLCSVEKVIESAQKMIEDGYIHQVLSLRFGYVVYSNPNEEWEKQRSAFDIDTWYLVPSWVMECYILENPKVDKLPEYPGIWEMTINAQTGEMMDHFDKSLYKRGDARYKGFIPWDKVK